MLKPRYAAASPHHLHNHPTGFNNAQIKKYYIFIGCYKEFDIYVPNDEIMPYSPFLFTIYDTHHGCFCGGKGPQYNKDRDSTREYDELPEKDKQAIETLIAMFKPE